MNAIEFCQYDGNDEDYAWLLCECPSNLNYGWRIPKSDKAKQVSFKCPKCKTEIGGLVPARTSSFVNIPDFITSMSVEEEQTFLQYLDEITDGAVLDGIERDVLYFKEGAENV